MAISAIVTDSAGLGAIAGGNLTDDSGASYGAFSTAGGQGTFTISLTWDAVNAIHAFNFAAGGGARLFTATFFDNGGNSASEDVSVALACAPSGDAACSGACVDLQSDDNNCGACNQTVPSGEVCSGGAPACLNSNDTYCGSSCTNTNDDNDNCGGCGTSCDVEGAEHGLAAGKMQCQFGVCTYQTTSLAAGSCAAVCAMNSLGCAPASEAGECQGTDTWAIGCALYITPGDDPSCRTYIPVSSCSQAVTATIGPSQEVCHSTPSENDALSNFTCLCQ